MIVKVQFEVQAAKTSYLALDAYVFRIIVNVLFEEFITTSMFLVGCHVGRALASAIDGYEEDFAATKNGHDVLE